MAVDDETVEIPTGAIDGANQAFSTPGPFQAGTLRVWRNGLLVRFLDDDGWEELDPGLGTFRIREAPRLNDTLVVRYIEA